jgi:hypothetical protein
MSNKASLPPSDKKNYDPNRLLNILKEKMQLRSEGALSRTLAISRPLLDQIRKHSQPVGAWLLLRMQEVSQISVEELRHLMGDRRQRIRVTLPPRRPPPPQP